jgi:hypothetical protein
MMSYGDALSRGTLLHGSALSYGFLFGRGGVCTLGELLPHLVGSAVSAVGFLRDCRQALSDRLR